MLAFLLTLVDEGQREAIERIYYKYHEDLYKLALSLLSQSPNAEDNALDAVQNVFVNLIKNYERLSFELDEKRLKAYLFTSVSNQVKNIRRNNRKYETVIVTAVEPRLNNGSSCNNTFTISSSGLATVNVRYTGISGVTTKVTSTVYIQKKFLGLFWTKVDIGTTDDEWVDSSTNVSGAFSHSVQLGSSGTYRAVFEIKMYGSGGATDTIEDKIEKKY